MTVVRTALQAAAASLEKAGVDSPLLTAELLLAHVLQLPRMNLLLNRDATLSAAQSEAFQQLVARRSDRIPLQHLVGSAAFLDLELHVSNQVLVPRPETEGLALLAHERLREWSGSRPPRVLDFATGSGCLALYLATHHAFAEVHALDLSPAALELARRNARRLKLDDRIQFHLGDGFEALGMGAEGPGSGFRFDLIVSNPPYIPSGEIAGLDPEVRLHEPHLALDGGRDGLEFYRRLAGEAHHWLGDGGWFLAEFGDGQAAALRSLFRKAPWTDLSIIPDLGGRERLLSVRKDSRKRGDNHSGPLNAAAPTSIEPALPERPPGP